MAKLNLNKRQLVDYIWRSIQPSDPDMSPADYKHSGLFMKNGITVRFGPEDWAAYRSALDMLLDVDVLASSYSGRAIESSFQSLVIKLLTEYDNAALTKEEIKQELNRWLEEVLSGEEHDTSYYAVVENLAVGQEIDIGSVTIGPLSEDKVHALVGAVHTLIDLAPYYSKRTRMREATKEQIEKDILKPFQPGERCALVSTHLRTKDLAKGADTASQRFEETLHLLRFFGRFTYSKAHRAHIGFRGELSRGLTAYLAISEEKGPWRLNQSVTGYLHEYKVTAQVVRQFRHLGLDALGAIVSKPREGRSEMERRLINSVIWISKATTESSEENQFLQLCIAIETLLGGNEREGITRVLAERLALVLSDDCEDRIAIYQDANRIFPIRGQVVHEGTARKEVELVESLPLAFALASNAVVRVVELMNTHHWPNFKQFSEYLQRLQFS